MKTAIAWGLLAVFLALIPLLFKAGREGSYRRGQGWYLDVSQPHEGPLPAYKRPPRAMLVPRRDIELRLVGGAIFIVLAVVTWLPLGAPIAAGFAAVIGLVCLGGAFAAWRGNRWLREPSEEPGRNRSRRPRPG